MAMLSGGYMGPALACTSCGITHSLQHRTVIVRAENTEAGHLSGSLHCKGTKPWLNPWQLTTWLMSRLLARPTPEVRRGSSNGEHL